MATPESGFPPSGTQDREWGAALALLPIAATFGYYALPDRFQSQTLVQFLPQTVAYASFALWASRNHSILQRLGSEPAKIPQGVKLGLLTGLVLGLLNSWVILRLFPSMGYDISFLTQTPHAKIPLFIMLPWFICGIALFVELNFRGFLLGRLAALEARIVKDPALQRLSPAALLISASTFTFDPFMTSTFQELHWIALWDGLVWGWLWLRCRNLCATVVAHAIEVMVMYSAVRHALSI